MGGLVAGHILEGWSHASGMRAACSLQLATWQPPTVPHQPPHHALHIQPTPRSRPADPTPAQATFLADEAEEPLAVEEPLEVMEEEEEEEEEPGRLSMTDVPAPHSTFTNSSLKPLEGTSSTWLAPWERVQGGQVRGVRGQQGGDARPGAHGWLPPPAGLRCCCCLLPLLPRPTPWPLPLPPCNHAPMRLTTHVLPLGAGVGALNDLHRL